MRGSTALLIIKTLTEDEITDLFDNYIILTNSNTWDPEDLASPREINITNNVSTVYWMKENVPIEGLCVCVTMERNKGYIEDGGGY